MDQNPEGQGQKSVVGNNQPNPTPTAPSGAIFSGSSAPTGTSPVGTPNQPTSGGSRPFFSHHPAHTFSREMGDIVVVGTAQPQKKRKTGLIIALVLICIAVIGVVITILVSHFTTTSRIEQTKQQFTAYIQLLQYGEGEYQDTSEWFIQAVANESDTLPADFDEAGYGTALKQSYETFVELSDDVSSMTTEEYKSKLQENTPAFNNVVSYLRMGDINDEIMNLYVADGRTSAENYISSLLPTSETEDSFTNTMAEALRSYFLTELEIFEVYNSQGCFSNGELNTACVGNINSEQTGLSTIGAELNRAARYAQSLFSLAVSTLKTNTLTMQHQVENINA